MKEHPVISHNQPAVSVPESAAYLSVNSISKEYAGSPSSLIALQGFSMHAFEGECVALLGPSGCGKSTLLRILAGVLSQSTGGVQIDGVSPRDYGDQKGTGFVFQRPVLFPWRTVWENVLLPAEVRHSSGSQGVQDRARHLIEVLGLSAFSKAYPRQLSGGMLQRASVARALLPQPKLLLLDEPFSALDDITRERLWLDFVEMWRKERTTLVLVTHSVREAVFFGDRVLLISQRPGKVHGEVTIPFGIRNAELLESRQFAETCLLVRKKLAV